MIGRRVVTLIVNVVWLEKLVGNDMPRKECVEKLISNDMGTERG